MRAKKIELKKKTVKLFVPIYTGLIHSYAETAKLSAYQLGLYVVIHAQADFSTGIWMGSAYKLLATVPRDNSLQACQRALRHMCDLGLLKDFRANGVRGNTPYLINKFKVRSGERSGQTLNAAKSTSLDVVVYDPDPDNTAEAATEGDAVREPIANPASTSADGSRERSDHVLNTAESDTSERVVRDGDAVGDTVPDTVGDAVRERIATQGDACLRSKEVKKEEVESKKKESKEKREKRGAAKPATPPLSREVQKLIAGLEKELRGQLSGWDWDAKQTEPKLHSTREWFETEARDQGIDFRQIGDLYVETMARVREQLEPAETIQHEPFTQTDLDNWPIDNECLEVTREYGCLTMLYPYGVQTVRMGETSPDWFPFENQAVEEPVQAHAIPDAPTDASTVPL